MGGIVHSVAVFTTMQIMQMVYLSSLKQNQPRSPIFLQFHNHYPWYLVEGMVCTRKI